jgi:hypothetical protein
MNYRIAKKILMCKSRLSQSRKSVDRAREELLRNPTRMTRDSIILVPYDKTKLNP